MSPPTVKEYFQILEDTMIGRFLPSFQKRSKRSVFQSPKFDLGMANYQLKRRNVEQDSEIFGHAFEHFISLDRRPRKEGDILILPWRDFLDRLWSGEEGRSAFWNNY